MAVRSRLDVCDVETDETCVTSGYDDAGWCDAVADNVASAKSSYGPVNPADKSYGYTWRKLFAPSCNPCKCVVWYATADDDELAG